ncbi:MAG: GTPase Era, partial [Defluviitaleaceae bacterium]|nr:GTPase Era [Defluviitaleaceae bacterium]
MENHKSGFVTLAGRPNVGKSTLLNRLMGEKISIVSNKPQTTRNKIRGILTEEGSQIVFLDTPGIHKPKSKLGENMMTMSYDALADGDIIAFIISPEKSKDLIESDELFIKSIPKSRGKIFLIINKIDTVPKDAILGIIERYREFADFAEIIPISATRGENTDKLKETILEYLPEGPRFFPEDMSTDMPERFLISETIREKALFFLQDELPHGIAVDIDKFALRENQAIIDIEAVIYCDKDSHKGMIIGKGGAKLKEIGTSARLDIQRMYDEKINLQVWV